MQSLWMLFASFMFAIMGVCVKLASDLYSTSEILMYRGCIGTTVLACVIMARGGSFRTSMPMQHFWRSTIGVISLWLWFYAIGALPLGTAITLNYMSPIWIAVALLAVGWWRGGNLPEWPLVAAVALSFVGVTLLLQPAFAADQAAPAFMGLVSGVATALAYLQVRKMGQLGEPDYRVVFYFSVINIVAGLIGKLASGLGGAAPSVLWHSHTPYGLGLLLAVGLCATVAQFAMTRAYRLGNILVVANLQYSGILFSTFWGVVIFSDVLDWHSWAGISVILVSGIAATYYNTRITARGAVITTTDPIASEV